MSAGPGSGDLDAAVAQPSNLNRHVARHDCAGQSSDLGEDHLGKAGHISAVGAQEVGVFGRGRVVVVARQLEAPDVVAQIDPAQQTHLGQVGQVPVQRRAIPAQGIQLANHLGMGFGCSDVVEQAQHGDARLRGPQAGVADALAQLVVGRVRCQADLRGSGPWSDTCIGDAGSGRGDLC